MGVSLTKARLRHSFQALDVGNELETLMIESGYLEGAPFSWVTIAIRYGLKNDETPQYVGRINKRYGDLPLAIEVDTHELLGASLEEMRKLFKVAVLKALIHAGRKYSRPITKLEAELAQLN